MAAVGTFVYGVIKLAADGEPVSVVLMPPYHNLKAVVQNWLNGNDLRANKYLVGPRLRFIVVRQDKDSVGLTLDDDQNTEMKHGKEKGKYIMTSSTRAHTNHGNATLARLQKKLGKL